MLTLLLHLGRSGRDIHDLHPYFHIYVYGMGWLRSGGAGWGCKRAVIKQEMCVTGWVNPPGIHALADIYYDMVDEYSKHRCPSVAKCVNIERRLHSARGV